MANVLRSPVDLHLLPASHSSFAGNFNVSPPSTMNHSQWQPTSVQPTAFQHITNTISNSSPTRALKRRIEHDDVQDSSRYCRDESMDRSPTPERPKRPPPKRVKVLNADSSSKDDTSMSNPASNGDNDMDLGVLLATLPPESLLPLLNSLISSHPSLKPAVLSLIPRPTLETALQSLAHAAKKLMDAYPYSNTTFPSLSSNSNATGVSNGNRPAGFVNSTIGFGFGFGSSQQSPLVGQQHHGGMRDSYVTSRLRPHIADFMTTCLSYLPYFSYIPSRAEGMSSLELHPNTAHAIHHDKFHPSETYVFLSAMTRHWLGQPCLTRSLLNSHLAPRLKLEWETWIAHLDVAVNRNGGMFGVETVKLWERELDAYAETKVDDCYSIMKFIRDAWVSKVGWLVNRSAPRAEVMEEL